MSKILNLQLSPQSSLNEQSIKEEVRKNLQINDGSTLNIKILKRSIDARGKKIKINLKNSFILSSVGQGLLIPFDNNFINNLSSDWSNSGRNPQQLRFELGEEELFNFPQWKKYLTEIFFLLLNLFVN